MIINTKFSIESYLKKKLINNDWYKSNFVHQVCTGVLPI